jgi:hypothetical protein
VVFQHIQKPRRGIRVSVGAVVKSQDNPAFGNPGFSPAQGYGAASGGGKKDSREEYCGKGNAADIHKPMYNDIGVLLKTPVDCRFFI